MPTAARKPCAWPGCNALTTGRFCEKHCKGHQRQADSRRGTRTERGYSNRWLRYRLQFLRQHPLCVRCAEQGRAVVATVVDHIQPHKGDQGLFWDIANHQPLCKPCHDRKTATEDGGFGRALAPRGGGGSKV